MSKVGKGKIERSIFILAAERNKNNERGHSGLKQFWTCFLTLAPSLAVAII